MSGLWDFWRVSLWDTADFPIMAFSMLRAPSDEVQEEGEEGLVDGDVAAAAASI